VTEIITRDDFDVDLIDVMGSDQSITHAAKVSTLGADSLDTETSVGLINFLMKNRHGTPFEHASMTFRVTAPIFVWREFHRHRIGFSYNEESGRYKQLDPVFYVPSSERNLIQEGKPGHYVYVPGTVQQVVND
jgi:thymidylate synthase (FAD)